MKFIKDKFKIILIIIIGILLLIFWLEFDDYKGHQNRENNEQLAW